MISQDRLDELDTFRLDDDTPDDARVSLPARDVRDLVRLVSVLRAAVALRDVAVDPSRDDELHTAIVRFDEERCAT